MKVDQIKSFRPITFILCNSLPYTYPPCDDNRYLSVKYPEALRHPNDTVNVFTQMLKRYYLSVDPIPLVINTFSEPLLNATGHLIMSGLVKSTDVIIYIIDEKQNIISECEYNSEGYLQYIEGDPYHSWPFGFLSNWSVDDFVRENGGKTDY